jgi:CubicO group peptidase (beta-lactamase class C family)
VRNPATRRFATLVASIAVALGPSSVTAQSFPAEPSVDRLFAEWDHPTSPGCALGVVRNGRFVYQRGYGMANLDYDIPNSPRLVYYVGSDSKQFTAAAIALLSLQGKLSLDDDVRKYVPEMPDYRQTYGVPVTIRQMVHHTSGIRDIYTLMSLVGLRMEDVMTDEAMLRLIANQKELNFKPGSEYLYSNSAYWLLGQIVQRVTGLSLRVFAEQQIFRPLGMTKTHFHDDPGHVMKGRAMSYVPDGAGGFRISYLQNFDKIGAGGLYSTVEDLQKWDENFYSHRVGGPELHRLLLTRGVLSNGDTISYAFGNQLGKYRGLRTEEHGGALMGYKAHILRFPDQRFTVIETCNLGSIDPGAIAQRIADIYLGPQMTEPATAARPRPRRADSGVATLSRADLDRLVGQYYSEELSTTYEIVSSGDAVILRRPNRRDARLQAADRNTFRIEGDEVVSLLSLHFEQSGDAPAPSFTVAAGRVTNIRFRRQ